MFSFWLLSVYLRDPVSTLTAVAAKAHANLGLDYNSPDLGIGSKLEHGWDPKYLGILTNLYGLFAQNAFSHVRVEDSKGKLSRVIWDVSTNCEFSFIWQAM